MTIKVVAIQNGPYKSGFYFITCLKGGLNLIAENIPSPATTKSALSEFIENSE